MRSESEMYELILDIAKADERICAVYMNGSRTNVNAPKDIFQDYDVVYVVTDTKPFIQDKNWINKFGEIWYMQYPDEHPDYPSDKENFYGWLMQFKDGNRIDLHVESVEHAKKHIGDDKLCKILLDKENILPPVAEATDAQYHVKKPTQQQFACVCNEFWWCLNNVAKGLWREEITYVQDMLNFHVRKQLEKMLSYRIGVDTDFSVSVGKSAKYMYRWLSENEWQMYLLTYSAGNTKACWEAVFIMCDLFEATAKYVADKMNYTYNQEEAYSAKEFLEYVSHLSKTAQSFD